MYWFVNRFPIDSSHFPFLVLLLDRNVVLYLKLAGYEASCYSTVDECFHRYVINKDVSNKMVQCRRGIERFSDGRGVVLGFRLPYILGALSFFEVVASQ